ncbi:MAG: hypothetical protein PHS04_17600 [Tissierellia bacterium]|jgi:hypothetical protein|nr:hypothetical protein [Tissierellia bacterium]
MYYKSKDEITKKNVFIQETKRQLALMSSQEKDKWIIMQAQLLIETKQQDFLKSLSREKLIIDMPSNEIIDEFCKQVSEGKICLEYETHYYEFDDTGRYMDDWEVWYNDPNQSMYFLDNIFKGCHDLNELGEYEQTNKILGQICRLEFCIVEAEDSEDFSTEEEPFTIDSAYEHGMLATNKTEVVYDWLYAFYMVHKNLKAVELAQQLIELLMLPLCNVILPSNVIDSIENKEVHNEMILLLETIIEIDTKEVQEKYFDKYSREGYYLKKKLDREMNLIDDLKKMKEGKQNIYNQISILNSSWKQIQELIQWLSYEPYIDDQLEIDQIWNICEALVRHLKNNSESWDIRKRVLQDIVDNDGYDYYGCIDPMTDLLEVLCNTGEEYLDKADIMMKNSSREYQKQAAKIYYEYGHDEEYVLYLKRNIAKSADVYLELIEYYDSHNNTDEAIKVANEALDKCRDSKTTEIFIFLIKEAYKSGNKTEATKLYRRAKQRKNVLTSELSKAFKGLK